MVDDRFGTDTRQSERVVVVGHDLHKKLLGYAKALKDVLKDETEINKKLNNDFFNKKIRKNKPKWQQ